MKTAPTEFWFLFTANVICRGDEKKNWQRWVFVFHSVYGFQGKFYRLRQLVLFSLLWTQLCQRTDQQHFFLSTTCSVRVILFVICYHIWRFLFQREIGQCRRKGGFSTIDRREIGCRSVSPGWSVLSFVLWIRKTREIVIFLWEKYTFSFLPDSFRRLANFHRKAFCGTFSADGNTFLSACQGTYRLWWLVLGFCKLLCRLAFCSVAKQERSFWSGAAMWMWMWMLVVSSLSFSSLSSTDSTRPLLRCLRPAAFALIQLELFSRFTYQNLRHWKCKVQTCEDNRSKRCWMECDRHCFQVGVQKPDPLFLSRCRTIVITQTLSFAVPMAISWHTLVGQTTVSGFCFL